MLKNNSSPGTHQPRCVHRRVPPLCCRGAPGCPQSTLTWGQTFFPVEWAATGTMSCVSPSTLLQSSGAAGDSHPSWPHTFDSVTSQAASTSFKIFKPLLAQATLIPRTADPSRRSPRARGAATEHLPTACFHPSASQLNAAPRPYCAMTAPRLGTAPMAPPGWFRPRGQPK